MSLSLNNLLKIAISGIGLTVIVLSMPDLSLAPRWDFAGLGAIVGAMAMWLLKFLISARRWQNVLLGLGHKLSFVFLWRTVMIGQFFNQFGLTAFGGDAVKTWMVRQSGVSLKQAGSSVLSDRLLGLTALYALLLTTAPVLFYQSTITGSLRNALIALIATGGVIILAALVFKLPDSLLRFKVLAFIDGVLHPVRHIRPGHPAFAVTYLGGYLVHFLGCVSAYFMTIFFQLDISFLQCLLVMPIAFLSMIIPISFAGWGVREGVTILVFTLLGVSQADALLVSVGYGLSGLLAGMIGGIMWLLTPGHDLLKKEMQAEGPEDGLASKQSSDN